MKKLLIIIGILAVLAVFLVAGFAATQKSMEESDRTIERVDRLIREYEAGR